MSFWEKGYLATAVAVAFAGSAYAYIVWQRSLAAGALVAPDAVSFFTYVIVIVVLSAVAFIIIASREKLNSGEDDAQPDGYDERDKLVGMMSTGQASHVTSVGAYIALLAFILHRDGNILFYSVLGALAFGEVAMCLFRVYHYNRAI